MLRRELGAADAVVIGMAAMLGTGVFMAFPPAAAAAGSWLLLALLVAAVVAACNAFSSADLAAAYPESGGTYVFAGRLLGRWPARLAGVAFLVGKTASAAAAAGALGVYLLPDHPRPVALAAVAALTVVNVTGIRSTLHVSRVLVGLVVAVLGLVVVTGLAGEPAGPADVARIAGSVADPVTPLGVLTAAALLFFAFAGYARMATLGEEVRDPRRTLRVAIPVALAVTLVIYLAVALTGLRSLGAAGLAGEPAPLVTVVSAAAPALDWLAVVVRAGAAVALVSVLLSVLVGVSRTALAMARGGDLPGALTRVGRRGTPWLADLAGAAVAATIALLAGPAAAIALSACSVLVYYAVTNAAAIRLHRPVVAASGTASGHSAPDVDAVPRWPRWTAYLGFALCVLLAVTLPGRQVLITAVTLTAGVCLSWLLARYGRAP